MGGIGKGDGYGYGSGSGDGSGDGDGSGYGSGSGSGDGSGSGSGDGSGDEVNNIAYYAAVARAHAGEDRDGVIALWRSTKDAKPANGGDLPPVKVGDIHETQGPLTLCQPGTLHATFHPSKWKGERWWVVAMLGDIAIGPDKIGALKREILAEVTR